MRQSDPADRLFDSVLAHDLPAMGDIDSSMLQFCSMVREHNKVALTGECADEIFGGYPWFHKKECFEAHTFPWTMDLSPRKSLLDDSFLEYLDMDRYVLDTYERSVAETPVLAEDSPEEARRREIAWLNLRWFMQTFSTAWTAPACIPAWKQEFPLRTTESLNTSGTCPGT